MPDHVAQVGAIGSLVVFAAAMATSALQSLLGVAGTLVALVVSVLFGNPSAGLYPARFIPGFWGAIGPWLPGGAGLSALRGSVYFGGTAIGGRFLLRAVCAVAGAAITIALGWRRGLRGSGRQRLHLTSKTRLVLADYPHFVSAYLLVAQGEFDTPIAVVRECAGLFHPVDLTHFGRDDPSTEILEVA